MNTAARHHRSGSMARIAKKPWTEEETLAVKEGVERWGKGKWSNSKGKIVIVKEKYETHNFFFEKSKMILILDRFFEIE